MLKHWYTKLGSQHCIPIHDYTIITKHVPLKKERSHLCFALLPRYQGKLFRKLRPDHIQCTSCFEPFNLLFIVGVVCFHDV